MPLCYLWLVQDKDMDKALLCSLHSIPCCGRGGEGEEVIASIQGRANWQNSIISHPWWRERATHTLVHSRDGGQALHQSLTRAGRGSDAAYIIVFAQRRASIVKWSFLYCCPSQFSDPRKQAFLETLSVLGGGFGFWPPSSTQAGI